MARPRIILDKTRPKIVEFFTRSHNVSETARRFNVSRRHLYRILAAHDAQFATTLQIKPRSEPDKTEAQHKARCVMCAAEYHYPEARKDDFNPYLCSAECADDLRKGTTPRSHFFQMYDGPEGKTQKERMLAMKRGFACQTAQAAWFAVDDEYTDAQAEADLIA